VSALLRAGNWRLVPVNQAIEISLQHPTLRPMSIKSTAYPQLIGDGDVATVGTTAFLAARDDTPDALVLATLQVLYQSPPLIEGMIARQSVAEWEGLEFHPAARAFFFHAGDE
jgi:TRAP-type uncharacterized transport system substrate-binding protein